MYSILYLLQLVYEQTKSKQLTAWYGRVRYHLYMYNTVQKCTIAQSGAVHDLCQYIGMIYSGSGFQIIPDPETATVPDQTLKLGQ